METPAPLTTSLVDDPRLWRLAVEISDASMHVALTSTVADQSLIHRTMTFSSETSSPVAALEEAVYDNALLLSEFSSAHILLDTPRYMLVPTEAAGSAAAIATEYWGPEGSAYTLLVNDIPGTDATVLTAVDPMLANFLNRTFPDASITNRIVPLCRYFTANSRMGNSDKLYVNQRAASIDVMAFGRGRLLMANTFPAATVADKVYYTLLAADTVGLGRMDGRVFVSGDRADLGELLAELRKYISYAMPLILPADIVRQGKEIHSIPFSLAIIPLCE